MRKKLWVIIIALVLISTIICAFCACGDGCTESDPSTGGEEVLPEGGEDSLPDGEEDGETLPEVPEPMPDTYYEITFLGLNGDIIYRQYVKEGETIVPPSPKSYDGYVFKSWDMPDDVAVKDVTVNAIYAKLYTVTLSLSGLEEDCTYNYTFEEGSLISSQITLDGVLELLPDGYYITGDYADEEFYDQLVTKDLLLEIPCEKTEYTVTFNCNAEGLSYPSLSVKHGESFTLPSLSRTGYLFGGWYTDSLFTQKYEPSAVMENITLYAKWDEITEDTKINLSGDEDIEILLANPHAQFTVTGDIDFSKIADAGLIFTGIFDGGNKTASLGNKPLFRENLGSIRNLDVEVNAENIENCVYGNENVYGAICGYNGGSIENCSVSGSIAISSDKTLFAGGICGVNGGTISHIDADISITCTSTNRQSAIGGIAGKINADVTVSGITGSIEITGFSKTALFCGGITGTVSSADATISNTDIEVTVDNVMLAGGLLGQAAYNSTLSGIINLTTSFDGCSQYGDIIGFGTAVEGEDGATVTVNGIEQTLPIYAYSM